MVQRVRRAAVRVGGEVVGEIGRGLALLVGVRRADTPAEAAALAPSPRVLLQSFDWRAVRALRRQAPEIETACLTIETQTVDVEPGMSDEFHGMPPGRYVLLAVSDTGTGMDEETQKQVFQPFLSTKSQE